MPTRLTFAPALVAVIAAGAAATYVPMHTWGALRTSLLPAMSVIAAAILVRLNRGFPFNNADQFTLEEARRLVASIVGIVKSLRMLIIAVIVSMLWLAMSPTLAPHVSDFTAKWPIIPADRILSGSIGMLLAYSIFRIFQVVQSDVDLAILQGELLERAIQRKAASQFVATQPADAERGAIAGASGFGRPLSN
jgi:hypothetical protein